MQSPGGPVAFAARAMLDQCEAFIRAIDGPFYAADSSVLKGGSIGKHVRHVLDHYRAIFAAISGNSVVDYDRRERNVPMETSPAAALDAIGRLRSELDRLGSAAMGSPIRIRVMLGGDGSQAELISSIGRELAFATHHAVHHHAMLGAIASEFGVQTGPEFGKAPSTINHERCSC
jgi:uncharacterized damage-inducible protein DinB